MTTRHRVRTGTVVAIVTVVVAAALVSAHAAEAKTFFVSTTGNDDHAGTEAEPFLRIQKAADRARAGDTIVLRGGVYAQTVVLRHSGEGKRKRGSGKGDTTDFLPSTPPGNQWCPRFFKPDGTLDTTSAWKSSGTYVAGPITASSTVQDTPKAMAIDTTERRRGTSHLIDKVGCPP